MTTEASPAVLDAGPLIHLDEVGCLDLLSDFRVHGTIGLIVRAIRRGQRTRDQVVAVLRSIPRRSSLHIKAELLEEICQQVAEHRGV